MTPTLPPITTRWIIEYVGSHAADRLMVTRWKDGIDISEPRHDVTKMLEAYAMSAIAAHMESIRPEVLRLAGEIAYQERERVMSTWERDVEAARDRAIRERDAARAALAALMGAKP